MAQPVAVYTDAVEEHLATRRSCGLFDFSFMGQFEIAGEGARAFLTAQRGTSPLVPGRIAYIVLRRAGTVFIDSLASRAIGTAVHQAPVGLRFRRRSGAGERRH
jgi:glycine cleavage system aminomethyltransferase T